MSRFPTMFHGFMGARADFTDADNFAKFTEGLDVLVAFFEKAL
jgi:hypothetical protein